MLQQTASYDTPALVRLLHWRLLQRNSSWSQTLTLETTETMLCDFGDGQCRVRCARILVTVNGQARERPSCAGPSAPLLACEFLRGNGF